jgi:hypothetical protein
MNIDAKARLLVGKAGLPAEAALIRSASGYLRRTRRGRRYGLIAGLVLGIGPLAGDSQLSLALPRALAGYLLGLLASELVAPRPGRPPRRSAALRARRSGDLVPAVARMAPWIVLVPVLASPLVALIRPARPAARIVTASYNCWAASGPGWPALPALAAAAVIALAGLVVTELALAALARRARPADDPAAARLDDMLRQISARTVVGGATALGLTLLGTLGLAVINEASRLVCSPQPGPLLPAYPWAAHLTPWLQLASIAVLVAALVTLAACRRSQDPRRWRAPGEAS